MPRPRDFHQACKKAGIPLIPGRAGGLRREDEV